jgi:hypothetical protein
MIAPGLQLQLLAGFHPCQSTFIEGRSNNGVSKIRSRSTRATLEKKALTQQTTEDSVCTVVLRWGYPLQGVSELRWLLARLRFLRSFGLEISRPLRNEI